MSAGYERERKKSFQKTRRSKQIYKESAEVTPFGVHSNYRSMEPYPCTNSDRVFGYFHKSRFQCPDIEDREQVRLLADFYICLRAWELREGE